jgi:hypothetical protein
MKTDTFTIDCEAFGFLDLDVTYEEVTEDNSFDHEFGTEVHIDKNVVIYKVKLNEHPLVLTDTQYKDLEEFITEQIVNNS